MAKAAVAVKMGWGRRLFEALKAWEETIDYSPHDYAMERVDALERQVSDLRDEVKTLRVGGSPGGVRV